eukprot:1159831-Pelagomonas_calceolata.AAC.15
MQANQANLPGRSGQAHQEATAAIAMKYMELLQARNHVITPLSPQGPLCLWLAHPDPESRNHRIMPSHLGYHKVPFVIGSHIQACNHAAC